ncbi:hypothetical protein KO491_17035 [Roseovarius nubinhibens]|uniref:hypothetical protein n=1 Tax=Roseovarius nubinhibens TaxID=314263 RepID=UPI001C07FB41|nr:hypothetical protein [Roseovarius nubinhibens]MBU3001549.1 hypothetical protein [Roseovarius nubinhibens]
MLDMEASAMLGVVLWSDVKDNRAVVWCDDHGDLAFYKPGKTTADRAVFQPGDLIQFELREASQMRIVARPQMLARDSHPNLADELKQVGEAMGVVTHSRDAKRASPPQGRARRDADVIRMDNYRRAEVA